jgi:carboxyl-terminal processing protease
LSKSRLLIGSLVVVAFIAGGVLGGLTDIFGRGSTDLTAQALDVIEQHYFEKVNPNQLENVSVNGIVDRLRRQYHDRFSHYFDPKAFERFQETTEGRFSGVGLSVTEVPRGLRVAMVFDDSPAKRAGVQVGDVITGVNGRSIAGLDANLATSRIKGPAGTEVELTVLTPSTGEKRQIKLERASVKLPVVQGSIKRINGVPIAYVQLLGFSSGVHAELRDELERLYAKGAKGLVLDLRGNGGGLLTEAVLTSSLFVQDGVIVSTEGRTEGTQTYDAVGDALPEHPTVVLINGDSASASEILTSALSDAGVATVVGQRSFGKGTFQQVIPLQNGGALDLTIGKYLARNGESVNNVGIKPDVVVRNRPGAAGDEALQRALKVVGAQLGQK